MRRNACKVSMTQKTAYPLCIARPLTFRKHGEDSRLHGVAPRAPEFDFGPASRGVMAASRIGREAWPNLK